MEDINEPVQISLLTSDESGVTCPEYFSDYTCPFNFMQARLH